MNELDAIVQHLEPLLGSAEGAPAALDGGITNRNFRARLGGRDYVIRLPGRDTALLGIDRQAEREAGELAAGLGVAPAVAAMLDDPPCLVTEFVPGRALTAPELRAPAAMAVVARALRTLHDCGATLPSSFSAFEVVERYADLAARRGATVPPAYYEALGLAHAIASALDGPEHDPVPCHNDLLAANFIGDGERVRIVDWEYAGMGDRFFDLGNFAVNNELDDAGHEHLLEAYFGRPASAREAAALGLMRFMSDFREAMWGVLQSAVSELDFDFAGYAQRHFARLSETAGEPRFAAWLQEARAAR